MIRAISDVFYNPLFSLNLREIKDYGAALENARDIVVEIHFARRKSRLSKYS